MFEDAVTSPNRTDPGVVDMCGLYSCAQMATYEPVFFSVLEAWRKHPLPLDFGMFALLCLTATGLMSAGSKTVPVSL